MLLGSVGTAIPSPPLLKLSPSIPPSTSSTTLLTLKSCNSSIKKPWISFAVKRSNSKPYVRSDSKPYVRSDSEPHIRYWKEKGSSKKNDGSSWEDESDDEMISGEEEEEDEEQQDDWAEEPEPEEIDQIQKSKHSPFIRIADIERARYLADIRKEVEQLLEPEERAILEQTKAPVFSKISTAKWQPLQTLALAGQIDFMDKLIEQGVHIDAVDKDGFTALHKAIIGKKEPVISHLLRKGANPHVLDRDGATPLHYAVQVGALLTVKLLIKYKVDVNVADNEGWTPLHVAIQSRNRDIAKILLVNGADKTRRTKEGKLALDLAICYGKDFKSYDLAKLLKVLPVYGDP